MVASGCSHSLVMAASGCSHTLVMAASRVVSHTLVMAASGCSHSLVMAASGCCQIPHLCEKLGLSNAVAELGGWGGPGLVISGCIKLHNFWGIALGRPLWM